MPGVAVNWHHIRILYMRELRSALRERTIVVNSILMPVFLYPVLLWVLFTGLTFVQGISADQSSRVVVVGPVPQRHAELVDSLWAAEGVEEVETEEEAEALRLLQEGEVDAVVELRPAEGAGALLEDNLQLHLRYDRAVSRSTQARERVESVVGEYRSRWIARDAEALGLSEAQRTLFRIAGQNVSTEEELGAMLLGQMISLFLVIMVALGCFVPSVDTTAGERERSTWETLMTVSASRASVVTAKYLYVATLGIVAGTLNVVALFVSIGAVIRPLAGDAAGEFAFTIPILAIPVMIAGAVGLALFFAAAMMVLASFARSFKDGQAMVQPVYWLVFIPVLMGQQSDLTLTPTIAAIPVANVAMMIRDAVNGTFLWPLIGQTLVVTLATVALALWAARTILRFEEFLLGSFDGSFWRFMKDRLRPGTRGTAASAASASDTSTRTRILP
jgi:sodium transport system permease protein